MREVDRLTTERCGIPSILLMENAAHAVARVITEKLGGSVKGKSILILCGKGNNGGDGAALGRILAAAKANISIELFGDVTETRGDARTNFEKLHLQENDSNLRFREVRPELEDNGVSGWMDNSDYDDVEILVDAIFGTGLTRGLDGFYGEVVKIINDWRGEYNKPRIVSVDIPSGLGSDSDQSLGESIRADVTVSFTAPKFANILPPGSRFNGELIVADIGSQQELVDEQTSHLFLTEGKDAAEWLGKTAFSSDDYKNKRGHTLIVAGSDDYSGAAVMCGNSAMRSGVGLATLLVPASCKVEIASRVIPEVIVRTLAEVGGEVSSDAFAANAEVIGQANSILVGPGLKATDKGVERLVREIVENRTVPVVVDAGALGFLNSPPYEGGVAHASGDGVVLSAALGEQVDSEQTSSRENHPVAEAATPLLRKEGSFKLPPLIVTPHEGEFVRLLGTDDKSAIRDRVAAVREFAVTNDVILVLKGERVLIGSPDGRVVVNPTGNSGLGKAGNGDTLAGILAGFVAQAVKFEIDMFETVVAAVYVAGTAGDVAEKKFGKRVMTASDVRECLVDVFAGFETKGNED